MNRTIGDIMERDVYTCRYDQNLGEIVALFNDLGTSGLAVIDEDRHVVGFISDGDIMKAVAAQKTRSIFGGGYANMVLYDNESFEEKVRALKHRNVMELAVQKVLCATADQAVGEIADVLAKKKFKRCRSSTRTASSSAWCAAPPSRATCSTCCSARRALGNRAAGTGLTRRR